VLCSSVGLAKTEARYPGAILPELLAEFWVPAWVPSDTHAGRINGINVSELLLKSHLSSQPGSKGEFGTENRLSAI